MRYRAQGGTETEQREIWNTWEVTPVRRIWPPEVEPERPLVVSDAVALRDWCVRFEVTLGDEQDAYRFANHYRMKFIRSAAVASANTAWVTFRTGAVDENDAAVLAAVTVKVVASLKMVRAEPIAAKLHHADDLGQIFGPQEAKLRAERQALLSYAESLGATRNRQVGSQRPPAPTGPAIPAPAAPALPRRRLRLGRGG